MAKAEQIIAAKICGDCKVLKALTDFYKRSDRDCHQSYCKKCSEARSIRYNKARYQRDPEFRKMHIEKMDKWRKANRERYNARMRPLSAAARKRACRNLTDSWVRHVLVQRTGLNRHDFPPDMVKAKAEQLKIKRKLKEQQV